MGMPRGSRWKRLAVFSDLVNEGDKAAIASRVLRAKGLDVEWWHRTVPRGKGTHPARNPIDNLMRDESPISEEWLMVRRGDWPLAFVLVKDYGVSL